MTAEVQLWKHFTEGSETALAELIRVYGKPLALYGRKLVRDDALIQDCIQETYIQLWQYRSGLRQVDEIRPYLFTCLRRKLITALRKERVFLYSDNETDFPFLAEFSIEDRWIASETEAERIQTINRFLNQLPRRQKEAVYLKFYENMGNDEIASVMGIKYQTASNLIHEALTALRERVPLHPLLLLMWCLMR